LNLSVSPAPYGFIASFYSLVTVEIIKKRKYHVGEQAPKFIWKLENALQMENELIVEIKLKTGKEVTFDPAGWFLEGLVSQTVENMVPLSDPGMFVSQMVPRVMWPMLRIYNATDQAKVRKCKYAGVVP
jgi:hypothetical protein